MRRFVIGDIHGAHRALTQCFERSSFDKHSDMLICLGDLCDGWPDVDKVLNELAEIEQLILVLGNHDLWMLDWFKTGSKPEIWLMQGGNITIDSFPYGVNEIQRNLMDRAVLYFQLDNMLFVHGGYHPGTPVSDQGKDILLWDRSLARKALHHRNHDEEVRLTEYDMVYVGHTPTINYDESKPITACGVCMMDTGAGWPGGLLTMMDIDSKEQFASNPVDELYKDVKGR